MLAAHAGLSYGRDEGGGLLRVGHVSEVDLVIPHRRCPVHPAQRIGREDHTFDGIPQRVAQHHALTVHGVVGGWLHTQRLGDGVQRRAQSV
ncbi:hypothetical protein ACIRQF_15830 [Streptomyces sp. NPDC101191]|uniref:hypothetical protein n=1 Tax=Streptomyces sp. NPDC101191 TaxID=3366126 RepID=UPI0037FEFFCD